MTTIKPTVTDEMIEQVAQAMADDWNPDRDPILSAMFRDYAATAIAAAAPLIAAQAWEQGYRAANLEWGHICDGPTVEPGEESVMCTECEPNPYTRKDVS